MGKLTSQGDLGSPDGPWPPLSLITPARWAWLDLMLAALPKPLVVLGFCASVLVAWKIPVYPSELH